MVPSVAHATALLLSCGFFMVCSAGMMIFNKLVLRAARLPVTVVMIQMAFTVLALCAASVPDVVRANEEEVEVEIGAASGAQSVDASAAATPVKKEKKYSSAFFELQHALADGGAAFTPRGIVEARDGCRHRVHAFHPCGKSREPKAEPHRRFDLRPFG